MKSYKGLIVGGTGHRLQKLPCRFKENDPWAKEVKHNLFTWLKENEPKKVITGMAIGWDMWLGEAAEFLQIPYDCYIPFIGQEEKWAKKYQRRYNALKENANKVVVFGSYQSNHWYQFRNRIIVDDSNVILTLWSGSMGGTYNALMYNKKDKALPRPTINFWKNGID